MSNTSDILVKVERCLVFIKQTHRHFSLREI